MTFLAPLRSFMRVIVQRRTNERGAQDGTAHATRSTASARASGVPAGCEAAHGGDAHTEAELVRRRVRHFERELFGDRDRS